MSTYIELSQYTRTNTRCHSKTGDASISAPKPVTPIRFPTDSDVPLLELAYPPSSDSGTTDSSAVTKRDELSPVKATIKATGGGGVDASALGEPLSLIHLHLPDVVLDSHSPVYARFPRKKAEDDEKETPVVGRINAALAFAYKQNTGPGEFYLLRLPFEDRCEIQSNTCRSMGRKPLKRSPTIGRQSSVSSFTLSLFCVLTCFLSVDSEEDILVHAEVRPEMKIRDFIPSLEGYENTGYVTSNAMRYESSVTGVIPS